MDYNLTTEIMDKNNDLSISIKQLRKNGYALAKAERDYKVEVCSEALRLRESGMAVTLIDKVIYGKSKVAELRFKRDVAQVMYDTNKEHINTVKLQLRLLEAQLNREWGAIKN